MLAPDDVNENITVTQCKLCHQLSKINLDNNINISNHDMNNEMFFTTYM
jgi:hypothetical protein